MKALPKPMSAYYMNHASEMASNNAAGAAAKAAAHKHLLENRAQKMGTATESWHANVSTATAHQMHKDKAHAQHEQVSNATAKLYRPADPEEEREMKKQATKDASAKQQAVAEEMKKAHDLELKGDGDIAHAFANQIAIEVAVADVAADADA